MAADGVERRPLLAGAQPGQELEHAKVSPKLKTNINFFSLSQLTRFHSMQTKLQAVFEDRAAMYSQADLTVEQLAGPEGGSEPPTATAQRVLARLAEMLAASDTKKRLRSAPEAGSVTLRGGKGSTQF